MCLSIISANIIGTERELERERGRGERERGMYSTYLLVELRYREHFTRIHKPVIGLWIGV